MTTKQSFQLILCALLVALLRETQVAAMFMRDRAGAASRSSARRRRERRKLAALRHEHLSIAMRLAQALQHSSGPTQHEEAVESGEEVEVAKLPQGARSEALVSASEPHVLGLRAGRRQWIRWLQSPRLTLVGSSLALRSF